MIVGVALGLVLAQQPELAFERVQTLRVGSDVATWRILDVDADGRTEILCVGVDGRVLTWRASDEDGRFPAAPRGRLTLPHPGRCLMAIVGAAGEPSELYVATPEGSYAYALAPDGSFGSEPRLLAEGARFRLRTGRPLFCDIAQDVNLDGFPDLVLPDGRACELWLNREGGGARTFERTARIPVRVLHTQSEDADALSDVLRETFRIPRLSTEDVNGDGRADLVVLESGHRSYHLQDEGGAFSLEPDARLDLSIFRDTTPEAPLRPGRTLVMGDDASVTSSDLDADGIPDYVIAHRRKVWVFHGEPTGPQFLRPSSILKTAQDVSGLVLLHLDDDEYADLVIYKILVPSLGALVLGMFSSWDVEITTLGYTNLEGKKFAIRPSEQGVVLLRLPPLLEILQRPEELIERLEEAGSKFRAAVRGDFDGDGVEDVALVSEDAQRLELWRTDSAATLAAADEEDDALVRRLLFDQEDPVFGVDRALEWFADFGERRTKRLTGDRPPDASIALGEGTGLPMTGAIAGDVDGDGRDEIVTVFEAIDGKVAFDVLRVVEKER